MTKDLDDGMPKHLFHNPAYPTECSHGVAYSEDCQDCEIDWHRKCLEEAQRAVAHHRAALDRLARSAVVSARFPRKSPALGPSRKVPPRATQ